MKNIILIISVLLIGACFTTPTVENITGKSYDYIKDGDAYRIEFLGTKKIRLAEEYENGIRLWAYKWSIVDGEIHLDLLEPLYKPSGNIVVLRNDMYNDLTKIAKIRDGKRTDFPKEKQTTIKKIK